MAYLIQIFDNAIRNDLHNTRAEHLHGLFPPTLLAYPSDLMDISFCDCHVRSEASDTLQKRYCFTHIPFRALD